MLSGGSKRFELRRNVELSRLRFKEPLDFMCEYEPFHSLHDGLPVFESDTELDEFCFHNYILIVFLAFAEEARTMVRLGKWDITRVRSESMAFLSRIRMRTYDNYGFDRHGGQLRAATLLCRGVGTNLGTSGYPASSHCSPYFLGC
jgi:hypothetical protein